MLAFTKLLPVVRTRRTKRPLRTCSWPSAQTGHRVCRSCFRHVSSQAPGALLDEEGLRASEDTSIQTEIVVAANAEEEAVRESEATSGNSKDMEHAESWYDGVMNSAGRMFDRS